MISRLCWICAAALLFALTLAASATAHPERPSFFPQYPGKVPTYRTSGPSRVVCADDTRRAIANLTDSGTDSGNQQSDSGGSSIIQQNEGRQEVQQRNEALFDRCRYHTIQSAVNAANNGDRILILPGTYREEPSRRVPSPDPRCEDDYTASEGDPTREVPDLGTGGTLATERAPTYAHHRKCPNSHNLIAIAGDRLSDRDRKCDDKCNLQVEGTGGRPSDVRIIGARDKDNAIRADRADGIMFRNFLTQYSDFNNIYVHETNGFHHDRLVTRWSREYGLLSFTSDHGLYERIDGYGTGDSAIYPGSGPQRAICGQYGIEVRNVNSHHNTIGHSGTAGDSTYVHDSRFHHNAAGITADSFAAGHPGMPQDCSRFENNRIYSNNTNYFNNDRDRYCRRNPPEERDRRVVCPAFQVPVGTGLLLAGANGNLVKNNWFFDNWRNGARLLYVPALARGEDDLSKQRDTSHRNRFEGNRMGVRPDGTRDPNGNDPSKGDGYADFWWDDEGRRNCWKGNRGPGGRKPTTAPPTANPPPFRDGFPLDCPVTDFPTPVGDESKTGSQTTCAAWDPQTNPDPIGCDWFRRPPEPR